MFTSEKKKTRRTKSPSSGDGRTAARYHSARFVVAVDHDNFCNCTPVTKIICPVFSSVYLYTMYLCGIVTDVLIFVYVKFRFSGSNTWGWSDSIKNFEKKKPD